MTSQLEYEINKELGECYLFMGEVEKAESYYLKALENCEGQTVPHLALAAIAIQKGKLEEAESYYKTAIAMEASDKALAGLGLVYMEQGKDLEAYNNFKTSLEYNPCNSVSLNCLVRQAYKLSKIEEIITILEDSLKIRDHEDVRVSLAGCLVSLGRFEEARKSLVQVLNSCPSNSVARELFDHLAA